MTVCQTCHVGEKNDALYDINKEMIFASGQLQKRIHYFLNCWCLFFICICLFFYSFLIMFLPAIIFAFVRAVSFKHWLFLPRARYDWNLEEKIMKNKSWLIQVKVTNAFQHFAVGCFQSKSHHSSQLERLRQLRKGPLRTTMHI